VWDSLQGPTIAPLGSAVEDTKRLTVNVPIDRLADACMAPIRHTANGAWLMATTTIWLPGPDELRTSAWPFTHVAHKDGRGVCGGQ